MRQAAIWIDQGEARVFHVEGSSFDERTVHAPHHHVHRRPQDEERFFADVLTVLKDSEAVLVVGPSVTKLHFLRYAQKHSPGLAARIVGIETVDHPTDRQIAAYVRHYFDSDSPRLHVAS